MLQLGKMEEISFKKQEEAQKKYKENTLYDQR